MSKMCFHFKRIIQYLKTITIIIIFYFSLLFHFLLRLFFPRKSYLFLFFSLAIVSLSFTFTYSLSPPPFFATTYSLVQPFCYFNFFQSICKVLPTPFPTRQQSFAYTFPQASANFCFHFLLFGLDFHQRIFSNESIYREFFLSFTHKSDQTYGLYLY